MSGYLLVGSDSFWKPFALPIIHFKMLSLENAAFLSLPSVNRASRRLTLSTLRSSGVEIEGLCFSTAGVPAHMSPVDYNVFNPSTLASPLTQRLAG